MADTVQTVAITGIGLVSSLGEGIDAHLSTRPQPALETARYAPRSVHPLPAIDWSQQIPKKDQRQMETWQRLGVYAAGLALSDAGIAGDEDTRSRIDMIVAAGGGERDPAVDALAMARTRGLPDPEPVLNEVLASELRPTLFLAQLSNLVAGNISIVHKVTGSSRTFMGEEGAGVSAIQVASARIASGQSDICLVGGAFSAERLDLLLNYELADLLLDGSWHPVFSREGRGGLVPGSVGAFLILESKRHAQARGASTYATIAGTLADRGAREPGGIAGRLPALIDGVGAPDQGLLVLSGASGLGAATREERDVLAKALPGAALRAYGDRLGHSFEAHFTAGIALGAAALSRGVVPSPSSGGEEREAGFETPRAALVTSVGHMRGEAVCLLERSA